MQASYAPGERERLDQTAREVMTAHPRVIDLIARGAALNPDGDALYFLRTADDNTPVAISYHDFLGLLQTASSWFRKAGITHGDAVAILAPSCPATVVALWAATSVGISMPLNLLFSREAIAAQLIASKAKLLLVPAPGAPGGFYEKVAGLEHEIATLDRLVVVPLDGRVAFDDDGLTPDPDWRNGLGRSEPDDADRVAAMLPTGGTTGHPKIARLTHRNMVAAALGSMLSIGTTAQDRAMVALPLFHVGGAFVGALSSLAAGAAIYLPTPFGARNPEVVTNFWRILERFRITFVGLVPTSLGAVAAVPRDNADLSHLRVVGTGASTCPPEIERRFLSVWGGDAVRQIYGMTEFAGAITQVPHDKSPDGAAVGLPVALAEIAVLADGRLYREASPMGELLVRGPQVFAGYIDAKQTEGAFYDGWLRTGDLCRIEPSGQVLVTGRIKDLIIRGGHNIDPTMIEDVAMRFPGVALAAAVGRPDPYSGEVPMLFVTAAPGAAVDAARLADFMRDYVADAPACPKAIEIVSEIPLTPVGKIFKPRLREIAAEQAVRQVVSQHAPADAFTVKAVTDPDRGLIVHVGFDGGADAAMQIERSLGLLPVATQISSRRPA